MKRKIYVQTFAALLATYLLMMFGFSAYFLQQQRNTALNEYQTITLSNMVNRLWKAAVPLLGDIDWDDFSAVKHASFADPPTAAISLLNAMFDVNTTETPRSEYAAALYDSNEELLFHSGQGWICHWKLSYFENGEQKTDSGAAFLYPEKWFSPEDVERLASYRDLDSDSPQVGDIASYDLSMGDFWIQGMEVIPTGGIHVVPTVVHEPSADGSWRGSTQKRETIPPTVQPPAKPLSEDASSQQIKYYFADCQIETGRYVPQYSTPEHSAIVADQERFVKSLHITQGIHPYQLKRTGLFSYQYYLVTPFDNRFYVEDGTISSPLYLVTLTDIDLWPRCGTILTFVWLACLAVFLLTAYLLARNSWKTYQKQEAVEARRRQITQALAHDLKTPLATLSGCAENLLTGVRTEKRDFYAQSIWEQSQALDGIVRRMLELSRLETGESALRLTQVSLGQLCQARLARDASLIQEKNLTCTVTGDWVLDADKPLMERVIDNLFSNALYFTPAGGSITASLQDNSLTLENTGSHIPAEQLSQIWKAYHKADSSRSGEGLGLGLYLAGEILTLHHLSYRATNTKTGVAFHITRPSR